MRMFSKAASFFISVVSSVTVSSIGSAGCLGPVTDAEVFESCETVAEFQVISSEAFVSADQTIRTRLKLRLVESFKGEVQDGIVIDTPGGTIGGRSEYRSDSLSLKEGESYVLMMNRNADGGWTAQPFHAFHSPADRSEVCEYFRCDAHGPRPKPASASMDYEGTGSHQGNSGVPGSTVTPTGYFETNGQPTRFTTCDGDEPVPYIIDIDPSNLPSGMDQAGAISAVAEALSVWSASSSLKFRYEGLQSFGVASSTIMTSDRRLRIQLHDNFDVVTGEALGIGGGGYKTETESFTGGQIGSQGFQERLYGYVVIENVTDAPLLLDTTNFKRVLTHEIGHALGLEHSSENPTEPDSVLKSATMYFRTDTESEGATIQAYDVDRIQFGYPVNNSPPSSIDRIIPVVTTSRGFGSLPTGVLGLNRIRLRAFSRQGAAVTPVLLSSTSVSGVFSLSGSDLIFTPSGFFGSPRLSDSEIASGFFYESARIQFSDGANLSRVVKCNVIGFFPDRTPSDGLPDDWMTSNFGTTTVGALNSGRHPADDPDRDGLSNRIEFYLNTNPNSAASGPVTLVYSSVSKQLSLNPVRFAPYWTESSSTLGEGSWVLRRVGTRYQPGGTLVSDFSATTPAREFYRVATGP